MSDAVTSIVWMNDDAVRNPVLQLSGEDNVSVALRSLKASEVINEVKLDRDIPKGHKLALSAISAGARVLKYAQTIGVARTDIVTGDHVHTHNLEFQNTDATHDFCSGIPDLSVSASDYFKDYQHDDGRTGTRNYIAVLSSVNCSATAVRHIVNSIGEDELRQFPNVDGIAAFTHGTGCGMATHGEGWDNLQRVLVGYATHPNVGGVLFAGLGCEASQIQSTLSDHSLSRGPLLRTMNIQAAGGHVKTVARGRAHLLEILPEVNKISRQNCPASSLVLALQCGGSDAWSGIAANPALGYASDLLVAQGGTTVLAETPEIYGAEHLLTRRALSQSVAESLMHRIEWWRGYVVRNNGGLDNNASGEKTRSEKHGLGDNEFVPWQVGATM